MSEEKLSNVSSASASCLTAGSSTQGVANRTSASRSPRKNEKRRKCPTGMSSNLSPGSTMPTLTPYVVNNRSERDEIMSEEEAEHIGRRIAGHLQHGEFTVAQNIFDKLTQEYGSDEKRSAAGAIAANRDAFRVQDLDVKVNASWQDFVGFPAEAARLLRASGYHIVQQLIGYKRRESLGGGITKGIVTNISLPGSLMQAGLRSHQIEKVLDILEAYGPWNQRDIEQGRPKIKAKSR